MQMKIDCHECEMYRSEHCDDCLVTALLHPPEGIVDLDEELDPTLRSLSGAGLIPVLRFRPRRGPTQEGSTQEGPAPPPDPVADTG